MESKEMEQTATLSVPLPLDLTFLTEEERASILRVVKADNKLRKNSLTVLRKSMEDLRQKESEDTKPSCSSCHSQFGIFHKQAQCAQCKRNNVCYSCLRRKNTELCQLCIRERQYDLASVGYMPLFSTAKVTSPSPYGSELIHSSLVASKRSRSTPTSPTKMYKETLMLRSQLLSPLRKSVECISSICNNNNCTIMREATSDENLADTGSIYSEHCGAVAGGVRGKVSFAVWYRSDEEILFIRVIEAKGLAAAKEDGTSSPYVKTYLLPDRTKRTKRKTSFCRNTTNPVYNEMLKYKVSRIELDQHTLCLSVRDFDRLGRNQFLGEVKLPLENLDLTDSTECWHTLQEKKDENEEGTDYRGKIRVGLKFVKNSLHILVSQAKDLPPMDPRGHTNAFARCFLLPNHNMSGRRKTKSITANLNPAWNEELIYRGISRKELETQRVLEITLWDADIRGDNEFIGGIRLGPDPIVPILHKEWMDSTEAESAHWESMLANPGGWVEKWHTLRSTMDSTMTLHRELQPASLPDEFARALSTMSSSIPTKGGKEHLGRPLHLTSETNTGGTWPRRQTNKVEVTRTQQKREYEIAGEVLVGVQYQHKSLQVHIKQARGLAAADSNGFSDPYVKTYLLPDKSKRSKRKTNVKRKTLNPVYNDTLVYNVPPEEVRSRTLWLTVWDKDVLRSNQFLGEVCLPLGELNLDKEEDNWYKLEDLAYEKTLGSSIP